MFIDMPTITEPNRYDSVVIRARLSLYGRLVTRNALRSNLDEQ